MYRNFFKRFLDLTLSTIGFCILLPAFIIVGLALSISNKGNPFFVQTRPGRNEKLFRIIKFKTMNDKRNSTGELLSDAERLTPIGKFVRKTSLDEIPQLFNVIKGEMSLVGPRPLLPEYLPYYDEQQKRRHEVKPGITGLAQVSGRNSSKFSKRFKLDVEYVDNLNFVLDCKIIWLTIKKVFQTSDIGAGQTVDEVDDLGISKNLPSYHFSKKNIEVK